MNVPVPFFHRMMGMLPGKAEWFASLEQARIPAFNDIEATAECTGLLSRYPGIREQARAALSP